MVVFNYLIIFWDIFIVLADTNFKLHAGKKCRGNSNFAPKTSKF